MLNAIVTRLKEPSTYAGFAGLALAVGVSAPLYTAVTTFVAAAAALAAVLMAEKTT
jgi:hypothetical protein